MWVISHDRIVDIITSISSSDLISSSRCSSTDAQHLWYLQLHTISGTVYPPSHPCRVLGVVIVVVIGDVVLHHPGDLLGYPLTSCDVITSMSCLLTHTTSP